MDGREVHFSTNRIGLLDFSWTMKGNHVLKIVCHAAPPVQATPGFRQYDMFIDGQSFFNMPKVFELGVKGASADDNRIPGVPGGYSGAAMVSPRSVFSEAAGYHNSYNGPIAGRAPRTQSEEDDVLQRAIKASLQEAKSHLGERTPSVLTNGSAETDLLDFGAAEAPAAYAPAPAYNAAPAPYAPAPAAPAYNAAPAYPPQQYGAPSYGAPPATSYGGGNSYAQPQAAAPLALPPSTNGYSVPPPPQSGSTAPQSYGAPPPSYGAPPPTPSYNAPAYGAPASNYGAPAYGAPPQSNYGAPPSAAYGDQFSVGGHTMNDPFAPKTPSHNSVASDILKAYGASQAPGQYQPGQPFPGSNGAVPPSEVAPSTPASSLSMNGLTITEKEEKPQNPFEVAMKKLVNVDRIDEPAEAQLKLTMKKEEENNAKKNKNRSVPLPPVGQKVLGSGATLKDISKVKGPQKLESVMTPPPGLFNGDAAMAGALVVHGQGPPPLQPAGFGVVHMQGRMPSAYQSGVPQYR